MTPEDAKALAARLNALHAGTGVLYVPMRSVKPWAKGGRLTEATGGCYRRTKV